MAEEGGLVEAEVSLNGTSWVLEFGTYFTEKIDWTFMVKYR